VGGDSCVRGRTLRLELDSLDRECVRLAIGVDSLFNIGNSLINHKTQLKMGKTFIKNQHRNSCGRAKLVSGIIRRLVTCVHTHGEFVGRKTN